MKKFPIEIEIFKAIVHVTVGTSEEIKKECERLGQTCPLYENTLAHTHYHEGHDPHLYLLKGFTDATLLHESVHCANAILRDVGIKSCYESEEAQAYLIEYIFKMAKKKK